MKSNKTAITLLAAALFMFSVWWAFAATPPNTVSYQGFLTDAAGAPVNGTPNMQVVFYTVSAGGTGVYTETHSAVTVSNGQFNIQLGDGTAEGSGVWDTDVDFSQALWLEITVGAETLSPRIPLSTVPYARYALIANTATTADALSANGGNCAAGNYPLGVDASGAVEGCTTAGGGGADLGKTANGGGTTSLGTCTNGTLAANSTDHAGKITFSGANSDCTINFGTTYTGAGANGVSCIPTGNFTNTSQEYTISAISTSAVTIHSQINLLNSDILYYLCMGYQHYLCTLGA